MRIRKNSTYSEADALLVMRDKALELGYVWDVVNCPTPAWCIYVLDVKYDEPLFNISRDVWNRELRLWVCDCAEHVIHAWENWAKMHMPEHVNAPRKAIHASREYAYDRINEEGLKICRDAVEAIIALTIHCRSSCDDVQAAADAHYAARTAFSSTHDVFETVRYARYAVYYANRSLPVNLRYAAEEKEWQRVAFARRIDAVAPWRLV